MCKRRDSIEAMGVAADRLAEACEAEIHSLPGSDQIDRAQPAKSGIGKALRDTFREITANPVDMAAQLGRIK